MFPLQKMELTQLQQELVALQTQCDIATVERDKYHKLYTDVDAKLQLLLKMKADIQQLIVDGPRFKEIKSSEDEYMKTGKRRITGITYKTVDTIPSLRVSEGLLSIVPVYDSSKSKLIVTIQVKYKFKVTIDLTEELQKSLKTETVTHMYIKQVKSHDYDFVDMEKHMKASYWFKIKCLIIHTSDGKCHLFHLGQQSSHMPRYIGYIDVHQPQIMDICIDKYARQEITRITGHTFGKSKWMRTVGKSQ